jgi:hypothetical protein
MSKTFFHCSMCDEVLTPDESGFLWHKRGKGVHAPEGNNVVPKIHKREDGKVIKPDTYSPADVKGVLDRQVAEFIHGETHGEKEGTLQWS